MARSLCNWLITRYDSTCSVVLMHVPIKIDAQNFLDQNCKKTKSRLASAFRVQSCFETIQAKRLGRGL